MDRIKRLSTEILSEYKDSFGTDFSENKKMLNEITIVRSKGLKNEIAGYITKILLREHKFQARKQKLIDDEKKFLERNNSQEKESTPEPETVESTPEPETVESTPEPETVESTPEPETVESTPEPETVESTPEPETVESTPEPETVDVENSVEKIDNVNQETEQKTLAEEVVNSMEESEDKS